MDTITRETRRRGVTLIELLAVVAIILILLGLVFPAITAVKNSSKRTKAGAEVALLLHGLKQFNTEYLQWPTNLVGNGDNNGLTIETVVSGTGLEAKNDLIVMLSGQTNGATVMGNVLMNNPRQTQFMNAPSEAILKGPRVLRSGRTLGPADVGSFIDPWGAPYRYMCDFSYDGATLVKFVPGADSTNLVGVGVAVWSPGPDGKDQTLADRKDDIASWQ